MSEYETINGALRSPDGRFWMLPHRQFRTDGRARFSPDRLRTLVAELRGLLDRVERGSPFFALTAIRAARAQLDQIEYEAVAFARGCMWSWRDVGEVLGMSAAGAHRRFAQEEVKRRKQRGP